MKVVLEYCTPNAEVLIGKYAGECYNARRDKEACIKRAVKCMEDGHLATLRFAHATFHVSGISRVTSHQFVRSKHLDFLQQSQRYVNQEGVEFIIPSKMEDDPEVKEHIIRTQRLYKRLLARDVRKEDARFILPEATETSLYVVGNLQAWKDFIKLRADKHAQWEIREVAVRINNLLSEECPNLFHKMEMVS